MVLYRYRYKGLGGKSTPALTDDRWGHMAKPLLDFLGQPRSWPELHAWARSVRYGPNLVRQLLAWAEHFHHAHSFYRDEVLYWTSPRVSRVRLKIEDEAPVLRELDVGPVHGRLRDGDGEGEGDDEPVVAGVSTPENEFVGAPLDDGDV